ncbi:GNAT family N-acetyltransferase [Nocardia terpenica]|uniref:bifunctional acetate--CoA ligase family protein/GNAT family N-acetyltransferase n=1 Tax=Nocardia terpenica TaxID=455432 RepID=UPI001893344A|nr:bifunctional GNAT family N-acetyltransferase/acetate--CoA ligase family protein [Nocardia terpenica]MBF6065565.1 GNAT family N-acetyltransferase [Nocardia terpenica]MBF6108633.1 GNAT family N-acetyltransferase [Nocardia terpenica]MBF6115663.1 GNAT family N-acetyltransferase [Nocardia terpenica]MBF6122810.1 GNAT family N-acetyltransferase [Nocardia terpenica]MBF6155838.1 GNAT family N-acetyltransferase [Nocardia terpenica]
MTEPAAGRDSTPQDPPPPPQHWVADVLAADGGVVRVRPIAPADAEALQRFHAGLSDRTRYLRYFGPYPRMTPKDLYRTTHVDYRDRVGLVVELGAVIIAVGRYELLPDREGPRAAEVAFVVADEHQGRGLGSILLEHLAGAAAENGIETFVAEVLAENNAMVTVFRDAGYQVQRSRDGSVLHLEFAIDPTEALLSVRDSRERASEARSVGNLLAPRSVAVIGATPSSGRVGGAVLANLLSGVFQGPVFPVNPNRSSVRGVRAYPTVREVPDEVDLAVVAVPAGEIKSVLDDCMAKGVKGLVVLTAGFSEIGPAGYAAERDLVAAARGHGMRVVGPSALGIANTDPAVSMNATLAPVLPGRGRIGFFCQSGPLGAAILGEAAARKLGLSTFVSAGNRADVSGNDMLQYWDTDPDTDVVLLYLETFGNPRKFSRIARRVARGKPIVAVSSGRNATHTAGALDPSHPLDRSLERDLFAQAGIVQVDTISELFDCAMLLAYQPLPPGPRLAVIGNSAALGWLAVDAARGEGLTAGAPTDLGPQAEPADYLTAVAAAMDSSDVDAVIVIFAPPVPTSVTAYAEAIRAGAGAGGKPVLTTFVADLGMPNLLATRGIGGSLERGSIPSYPDPERAARALARVRRYADWRTRPVSPVRRPADVDTERARNLVGEWMRREPDGGWLADLEAVQLLDCYGIRVVEFREVRDPEAAEAAAEELGYPVAAKATGELWRNRPDLTGVRLDLWRPSAVRRAYTDLAEVSGNEVVHIQKMATKGVGCVLRVQDDPSFGSVISFGLSGTIIDLLGDRVYRALPLTEDESAELIDAPRAAPLLDGKAGVAGRTIGEPVDKRALSELARRISALCDDLPEIRELAVEPALASARGAAILYARVRIGPEPSRFDIGPRRLA